MMSSDRLPDWQNSTILILGDAMLDCYLRGTSTRLCQEAPVPVVAVAERRDVPGGAANTAANVSSLGGRAILLAVIGDDDEGCRLQQSLQQQGVRTDRLLVDASRTTLTKQRTIAASQLLVRADWGSTAALSHSTEQKLLASLQELFPTCDGVIVSDYGYGILTPRVIRALSELQRQHPRVVAVDSKQLAAYREVGVTAAKPNYAEAIQLLNLPVVEEERVSQLKTQGEPLLTRTGAKLVAVTLDREGALVFERDRSPIQTSATPTSNLQATGAGDTYISALTLALTANAPAAVAASLAAAATAVVVTAAGTTTCRADQLLAIANPKISRERSHLAASVQQYRAAGKQIVFTNGCFDILHPGHVTYLQQAKALGDILILGVNSDESVKGLKGPSRPINPLADRLTVLAGLASVDYVIAFDEATPIELLKILRPDIYVKGGDYTPETLPEAPVVKELGGIVKILPFVENRSTTAIIERIMSPSETRKAP
ncbi:MAG: D-glycero-beta-D-manno-heptose 1-phosphate adenylyltransferase [Cyanophyceae cyanobacterium]